MDVTIVLPAHNEIDLLESTVDELRAGLDVRRATYELVIVENGSTDGTQALADSLARRHRDVNVLHLEVGNYGAALAAGFSAARRSVVVSFDVDYYDLGFVDASTALLAAPGCSLVVASKRCPGSDDRRSLLRRALTMGFTAALRRLVAMPVSDAHGMKAFRRADLAPVVADCQMRGSIFDVEMVVRAGRAGLGLAEVPATVVERRPCRTSVWRRSLEGAAGVVQLRRIFAREGANADRNPAAASLASDSLSFGDVPGFMTNERGAD